MILFRFYWNNGTTSVWEGEGLVSVLNKAGYTSEVLKNDLISWDEGENYPTRVWNSKESKWERKEDIRKKEIMDSIFVGEKYICEKHKICDKAYACGGAQPHSSCSECGNCPMDRTAQCIPYKE